jgi:hypothetical protein
MSLSISYLVVRVDQPEFELITLLVGVVSSLIAVSLGWFLAKKTEEKKEKAEEIRNELEKAFGPLYSIVSRPEEMVKTDDKQEQLRVAISEEEKRELDRILMSYPHMLPYEVVVLWRTQIKNLKSFRTSIEIEQVSQPFLSHPLGSIRQVPVDWFGIPLEFRDKINKEYDQRLEEYYEITGKRKDFKALPKWART